MPQAQPMKTAKQIEKDRLAVAQAKSERADQALRETYRQAIQRSENQEPNAMSIAQIRTRMAADGITMADIGIDDDDLPQPRRQRTAPKPTAPANRPSRRTVSVPTIVGPNEDDQDDDGDDDGGE